MASIQKIPAYTDEQMFHVYTWSVRDKLQLEWSSNADICADVKSFLQETRAFNWNDDEIYHLTFRSGLTPVCFLNRKFSSRKIQEIHKHRKSDRTGIAYRTRRPDDNSLILHYAQIVHHVRVVIVAASTGNSTTLEFMYIDTFRTQRPDAASALDTVIRLLLLQLNHNALDKLAICFTNCNFLYPNCTPLLHIHSTTMYSTTCSFHICARLTPQRSMNLASSCITARYAKQCVLSQLK